MKLRLFFMTIALCLGGYAVAAEVKLADASASASIEQLPAQDAFAIAVAFRPVTTLDDVTNREMTEVMAQFYAEEALSKFLESPKAIVFSKAETMVGKVDEDAKKVKFGFRVPVEAVIDAPVQKVEAREEVVGKKNPDVKKSVGNRFQDFRSTCFRDLRIAEALYADEVSSVKGEKAVAKLRQKMHAAFVALREKIENDDNLFRAEKKELVGKVEKVERSLVKELEGKESNGARREDCDSDAEEKIKSDRSLPISDATFVEPFGKLLKRDPILLTTGGARVIEMKNGSIAVVFVGSARADNDDREEIAEMRGADALGRLREGEETSSESSIERTYTRSSGDSGAKENMDVKRVSRVRMNSNAFLPDGMEKVGTWFSKDGKKFFLAKGRIVRPKKGK